MYSQPTFSVKDLNWKADIINPLVNDFVNSKFDLLVNYYDVENTLWKIWKSELKGLVRDLPDFEETAKEVYAKLP